jgi:hypothetical protein
VVQAYEKWLDEKTPNIENCKESISTREGKVANLVVSSLFNVHIKLIKRIYFVPIFFAVFLLGHKSVKSKSIYLHPQLRFKTIKKARR